MDQEKIGKFIAARRKEKQLTQAQLAQRLGITDRAVSKWETGKSMPDASIMLELCGILDISVNELLSGEMIDVENYGKTADENLISLQQQNENNLTRNNLLFMIFSATMLTGIFVCLICDAAISGGITWAWIPSCSIAFAWAVLSPAFLWGKRGVLGSLVSLTVLLLPYLFVLSRLVKVRAVFAIGAMVGAPSAAFLWSAVVLLRRRWKKDPLGTVSLLILLAIPFDLIIDAILSVTLNAPFWDVWDMLGVCLLLLAALYCFIWRYAREKGWLKKRRKEPRDLE